MKIRLSLMLTAITCFIVSASASAGLVEDSAAFDRAYVPALALTNQRDKPQPLVEESMRRLAVAWEAFVGKTKANDRYAKALEEAVNVSTAKIAEATRLVAADKRKDAHEALEMVRLSFWKARTAVGISYLPDRFTAFHEPMEEFAELGVKPESQDLDLRKRLQELSDLWKDIEETRLDAVLFRVSPERAAKYADQVSKEREIIAKIGNSIGSPDKEAFAKALASLKANFAQAFFVFGDFSGLQ